MAPDSRELLPFADDAAGLLKALSHPARLRICCQLRDREMSVSEIEETLGIRQPGLSRELGKLREEGLVETRRQSKTVFYRLPAGARVAAMVDAVCAVMLGATAAPAAPEKASPETSSASPVLKPNQAGGYGVFARTGSNT